MGLETSVEDMRTGSANVERVATEVKTILDGLQARVQGSTAFWASDASKAFIGVMDRWSMDSKKLNDTLRNISESLRASAGGYESSSQDHVDLIGKTGGMLNL